MVPVPLSNRKWCVGGGFRVPFLLHQQRNSWRLSFYHETTPKNGRATRWEEHGSLHGHVARSHLPTRNGHCNLEHSGTTWEKNYFPSARMSFSQPYADKHLLRKAFPRQLHTRLCLLVEAPIASFTTTYYTCTYLFYLLTNMSICLALF